MADLEYDIAVAGGGLTGAFAAAAAAREGARTVLFDRYGFLGGMATAAPTSAGRGTAPPISSKPRSWMRKRGVSYSFVLERQPGVVWVLSRFPTQAGVSLREQDLLAT